MSEANILTDDEVIRLAESIGRGKGEFTEEELTTVMMWAKRIRIGDALLGMVLSGRVLIVEIKGDEPVFRSVDRNGK